MNMDFSLAYAYEKYFKIGAAVSHLSIDRYDELLSQHFNSLTTENELKYDATEPEEGKFTFEAADKIFGKARQMGVKVRAHAPVWHWSTPDWIFKDGDKPAAPELIYERIEAHTKALCERYNDDVYAWDVVNEATLDEMHKDQVGDSPVYRNSEYFKLCGTGFMEAAFRAMEKYSPNAQLFYNDYGECDPKRRERIVTLIRELREKGCRIDGFGMQQHHFVKPDFDEIKRSIEIYADMGLRLHVTELDVSLMATVDQSRGLPKPEDEWFDDFFRKASTMTPERFAEMDDIYVKLFEIYRSYSDVIDSVTTWGVADDNTWLDQFGIAPDLPKAKQYPLLFDTDHSPKPCVGRIIEAAR